MSKAVLSGYFGYKNFGDELILSSLINFLKSKNIEITVLSGNPEYTFNKHHTNSIKNFDLKNIISAIKETDYLISGGGSLLQDVTSLKSLIYYTLIIALGILFDKKVIIFAQGIGPINNKFARHIVMQLLKLCTLVTVRDENSLKLLNSYKIDAHLVCDPAYSLKVGHSNNKDTIGVQLRYFKTLNENLIHKLALMITTNFSDKKIKIFSLQNSQDLNICKHFEQILKSFNPEIKTEIVQDNIVEQICDLEYLIAMRFHSLLIALKAGVKCCAINYDIKVETLAYEANIPVISMDAKENFNDIYKQMQNLSTNNLTNFVSTKTFEWSLFEEFIA